MWAVRAGFPPALRESALTPQPHIGVGAFDLAQEENVMKKISMIGATLVGAAVLCAAPISLHQSLDKGLSLSVDKAQARIGRPLTPGSVAGVHRRHDRRAYRRGHHGAYAYGRSGYHHGYRRGYYGRPYVGGYYGHQRRVGRRVYRRHNY